MPIISNRMFVGYVLTTTAIYAVVFAAATTAGGDGLPEPQAHPETASEGIVGDPEPQRTSQPGALERVWTQETDLFRRCALKALAGEFGELRDWQRDAYTWGLAQGVACCGVAKVTAYGHKWESAKMAGGACTASNSRVHLGGCAANPELPFGTLVWTPYGLRYVTDRGGWVKLGYALVYGRWKRVTNHRETANLDYYTWAELPTLRSAPWAIVKPARQTDRGTWYRPMSIESEEKP